MSDTVIRVENLSKKYVLGKNGGSDDLRHVIHDAATAPYRWLKNRAGRSGLEAGKYDAPDGPQEAAEDFWALKDVSFEVKQGEVVGIIGRNGAGKSTLLKILTRITEQTEGRVEISGRVASLLEVGTGFHPELTGRENVFLNGAILGMGRAEIKKKFDEIVAFAGVERFLDTPVKRYSSGMYVRLAFAVAAHLEPEILIVDEVLAVGDAEFQKKCMGKMQDISKHGRTILFVSHHMATVSKLCQQCILLDGGRLKLIGRTDDIIPHYLKSGKQTDGIRTWSEGEDMQDPRLKMRALRVLAPDGTVTGHVDIRKPFAIEVEYQVLETLSQCRINLRVITPDGTIAFSTADSMDPNYDAGARPAGFYRTRCFIPGNLLNESYYSLTMGVDMPFKKILFVEEAALGFSVEQTNDLNTRFPEKWPGTVCPLLEWQTKPLDKTI